MLATNFDRRRPLTFVTCAALLFLSVPLAADASGGSSTVIADPVHPAYKAQVNSAGQLSVKVANTVPVTGTVKVGNTVPVTGTVNVGNTAPGQPYNSSCNTSTTPGATLSCNLDTVPAGRRLAITSVSVLCEDPGPGSGSIPAELLASYSAGSYTQWPIPVQPQGQVSSDWYGYGGALQGPLYVGHPQLGLQVICLGSNTQNGTAVLGTVSGYLY